MITTLVLILGMFTFIFLWMLRAKEIDTAERVILSISAVAFVLIMAWLLWFYILPSLYGRMV